MRLLIDARTLGDKPSGIGIYLYNFLQELKKMPGIELELLSDVVQSAELTGLKEEGIPVYAYGKQVKRSFGVYPYFRFMQKKIYERKPDIFWEINNLIPVKLKNPYGKVAVVIHDLFPVTNPEWFPGYYSYYFRYGIRRTLRQADMILYNTNVVKKSVEAYEKRATEIPNFVTHIIVDHMPELPAEDKGYFLYIGNMEQRKGTDLLLRAYLKYRREGGRIPLHLGGSIREEEIEKLVEECRKQYPDVTYLGYVSGEKKWQEYAGCSAFVFPSRAEGFGIPAVEALYYRKPVILSRLAVFEEVIGENPAYISLEDGDEKAVDELVSCMKQMENGATECGGAGSLCMDEAHCREVTSRYTGERLTRELVDFWERYFPNEGVK